MALLNQASREELIGKKFPILDHGHVVLMDVMGDDAAVAQAARVSYQKGTKSISDDVGLIRYLLRNRHTSPIEMCEIKLHVKLPIFVERQWVRHRMASLNEVSARYSELPEEYYIPETADVAAQSTTNKQGRDLPLDESTSNAFRHDAAHICHSAFDAYHKALSNDVARELARISLPVATYTEKVWKIDLHNLLHFLGLRMDKHAQWEIRQYANCIGNEIVAKLFPACWGAFQDYFVNALRLTALDVRQVAEIVGSRAALPIAASEFSRFAIPEWRTDAKNRERGEFVAKGIRLGLIREAVNMPVSGSPAI